MTDRKIIVVTGCRDWEHIEAVWDLLTENLYNHAELVVIHGDCPTGADRIARWWIAERFTPGEVSSFMFVADWGKHGMAAGPIRNGEMLRAAKAMQAEDESEETELEYLAFWDGKSKGTLDCIKQATAMGIGVRIVARETER